MRLLKGKNSLLSTLLFLIFPLSVIIDLFNGYTQVQLGIYTPIGQFFRIIILVLLLFYIYRKDSNYFSNYLTLYLFYFLLVIPLWLIGVGIYDFEGFNIGIEVENLIKSVYFWIIITFFTLYRKEISYYDLIRIISNYGLLISIAILFSFITGYGNSSFSDDYGFGTKSFFKAGNDLSITLLYSAVVSSIGLVREFSNKSILKTLLILIACVLIGTRVGIAGAGLWCIIIIIYLSCFYHPKQKNKRVKLFIFKLIVIPIFIFIAIEAIVFFISLLDSYMLAKFTLEGIQNARSSLTEDASSYLNSFTVIDYIFGRGLSCLYFFVGESQIGEGGYRVIEADFHEIFAGYGFCGCILVILPYLLFLKKSITRYMKDMDYINFCILFITSSFLVIALVAGHCLRNTMVAPIYGYIISQLYMKYESPSYKQWISLSSESKLYDLY